MSQLSDFVNASAGAARRSKEQICADGPADLPAGIDLFRGEIWIANVRMFRASDALVGRAGQQAIAAFDADTVVSDYEGYAQLGPDGRIATGAHKPGELQRMVEQDNALQRRLVTEVICVIGANRAGDAHAITLPYHYDDGHVTWDETQEGRGTAVSAAFILAMRSPGMSVAFWRKHGHAATLTREEKDATSAESMAAQMPVAVTLIGDDRDPERFSALQQLEQDPNWQGRIIEC